MILTFEPCSMNYHEMMIKELYWWLITTSDGITKMEILTNLGILTNDQIFI